MSIFEGLSMTVQDADRFEQKTGPAHDALNRMRCAAERGTGCRLTTEIADGLSRTIVGQVWMEPDPRDNPH